MVEDPKSSSFILFFFVFGWLFVSYKNNFISLNHFHISYNQQDQKEDEEEAEAAAAASEEEDEE